MAKPDIHDLLNYFPEVELPVTLSEEYISTFSTSNKPLPIALIQEFIIRWEAEESDEFTEYVPCLKIPDTEEYFALVYWKGGLLKYEFILVTLQKDGTLITRRPIASTMSDNNTVRKSVAKIDEDLIIHIVAGENMPETIYDPADSQSFSMEILPSGDVLFTMDEA